MGRKKKSVKLKPTLFIGCEGTSSEYQYFSNWAESDEVLEHFERVDVYPSRSVKNPKTTPYELYEVARDELKSGAANFAWIVFDKDNHPKLKETFASAVSKNIRIAFSSRSFEEWVILHFKKKSLPFDATECKDLDDKPINCGSTLVPNCDPVSCLTGYIRRENLIPDYSKKRTFDLFSAIQSQTKLAKVNSAWLRYKNTSHPEIFLRNPYTDVDQLINFLTGQNSLVKWGAPETDIILGAWTINLRLNSTHMSLNISHTKHQSEVLNNFPANSFFVTNDELETLSCEVISKTLIKNENGSTVNLLYEDDLIEFNFALTDQPYFLFVKDNIEIFVDLNTN